MRRFLEVFKVRILLIVLVSLLILVTIPTNTVAQDEGCVTAKCHADIDTKEFVHGPVGAKICVICHNLVEGKKHKFEFAAEKEELCFGCHEDSRDMMLNDHLHTPVANGNCVGCHDPHQTDYRFSLKGNAADLCYKCHKKEEFNKEFVHGPIGVGDCNACHNPHASGNSDQLIQPAEDICFLCHKEQAGIMEKKHIHQPVEDDCTSCHNPHSNVAKFLLSSNEPELCLDCHSDFESFSTVEFKHQPVDQGNCSQCHNVHASDNPRMFPKPQTELCYSCHSEMGDFMADQPNLHGPIKDDDCNACHNPHGSGYFRMLVNDFPEQFYNSYSTDKYSICFDCHNKDIALDEKTTTLTGFRDGDINMHYLHVNKKVKGRSCKACHQVHASSQEKHIRKSVPFGKMNWELPIKYTKYEDGGNCVVGCHAPKDYHR
ncbi:MAG: cytochrome C [Candidatus Zixiibacteriota bacterium]|nr:MAG: cytochrome C [candidate division Zixibacteria bacterium]